MEIRVIVAAHKPYWMPDDPMYLPLQVGAAGRAPFLDARDDTGNHISGKNATFCELTGLYWAWKNLDADALGLAHYRRHFLYQHRLRPDRSMILTGKEAAECLARADIWLPKKRHYWIETNYSQYAHAHHAKDLDMVRALIAARHPGDLAAYDRVMQKTSGHRFNMMLMKRPLADRYCEWLFDLLFALEERLDISGYSDNDRRVFGFVGERLLDVWLEKEGLPYRELPYLNLEPPNWPVKGYQFIRRKLTARRG